MPKNTMPVLFIGHGDPMNALWDNPFTQCLSRLGSSLSQPPSAILVISAHWLGRSSQVNTTDQPETIHDFYGFPEELYQVIYPAPGAPSWAERTAGLSRNIKKDDQRGLDHGAWAILRHLFPKADIPVFQLSIDLPRPLHHHLLLARELKPLRDENVLIIGSGNIVHNLQLARTGEYFGYDWAIEFDAWVKSRIDERDFMSLVNYEKAGKAGALSVPTMDHYVPLIYSVGLADKEEPIEHAYEEIVYGSVGMRCLKIGK